MTIDLGLLQILRCLAVHNFNTAIIDQRVKMKRGENVYDIARCAKLDYKMPIHKIRSDNLYTKN